MSVEWRADKLKISPPFGFYLMTPPLSRDTLKSLETLVVGDRTYAFYSLKAAEQTLGDLNHLPCCVRILLENLLRHEDDLTVTVEDMRALAAFHALRKNPPPLAFWPARLFVDDAAAISALTDLAALRDTLYEKQDDPLLFAPTRPVHVVTEETSADEAATSAKERRAFLRWGEQAFSSFQLIPPGKGNNETIHMTALARVVETSPDPRQGSPLVFPDTVLGTSRHLAAIGSLGVLAFQASVLDAEALLLDSNAPLMLTGVLGIKLIGKPQEMCSATQIALALLKAVKQTKSEGKIVEFYGPGLDALSIEDRAVIADLLSASGVVSVLFPIDTLTIAYLERTGTTADERALVEAYAKEQGLWRKGGEDEEKQSPAFTIAFEFNLDIIRPSLGGPGRAHMPQPLEEVGKSFLTSFPPVTGKKDPLALVQHGDIVWAGIGPAGSGLNPHDLVGAGLIARAARSRGLKIKPWVRGALTLPSPLFKSLLERAGLLADFEAIGFTFVEGKTFPEPQSRILQAARATKTILSALASSGDVFDRIGMPEGNATYIASPGLIVGYALAGSLLLDLTEQPLDPASSAKLKDLWPSESEITSIIATHLPPSAFADFKATLFSGDESWNHLAVDGGPLFTWKTESSFIRKPSVLDHFEEALPVPRDIKDARALAVWSDAVSTDLIVPHGPIAPESAAGAHLIALGCSPEALGSFEERTGNETAFYEGAFQNPALKNALAKEAPPGHTRILGVESSLSVQEAADRYRKNKTPYVLFTGQDFGLGRDQEWAAKILRLLGVPLIVAGSYAPNFRLNLIRAGILPLELKSGVAVSGLNLSGAEAINFSGLTLFMRPPVEVMLTINHPDSIERYMLLCRLDTEQEMETWRHGSLWAEGTRNLIMLAV